MLVNLQRLNVSLWLAGDKATYSTWAGEGGPWYLMRDYSSPSTDIIDFKKRLSQLLSVHKGSVKSTMSKDSILTNYEGNLDGFIIKIDDNNFTLSFDPNDDSLLDALFTPQATLLS